MLLSIKIKGMALINKFELYPLILLALPAIVLLMPILVLSAFFGGFYFLVSHRHQKQELV